MTATKSKIRSAVTSSFIRRAEDDNYTIDDYTNVPRYAPFEEPKKIDPSNVQEKNKTIDLKFISKTEIKILKKINSLILDINKPTDPIYLDQLALELEHPVSTLKKLIQKLELKGLIRRESFKAGRGGWSSYSINKATRDKLETN